MQVSRPLFDCVVANVCMYVDDPEAFDGSPVAVQIIGRRLQEEQVLAAACVVDDLAHSQSRVFSRI